ncbi:MAG: UPF0058 family protein [Methanoregula sp.]
MNKDQFLRLHQILADVKDELIAIRPGLEFPQYTALKITPDHTQISRSVYKHAVFAWDMRSPSHSRTSIPTPPAGWHPG